MFLVLRSEVGAGAVSGVWAWGALVVSALAVVLYRVSRRRRWAVAALGADGTSPGRRHTLLDAHFAGMPSLRDVISQIGAAERIPAKLFYAPLALNWIWLGLRYRSLSLPTLANPQIEVGGLWGESKRAYLDMITGESERWLARYVALDRRRGSPDADVARALSAARDAGIGFPMVAKPDIGWQGYGVRLVHSERELAAYVEGFPVGAAFLLQELVDWEGEAGVFYARRPEDPHGSVTAVTLRYFPHVVGDGEHKVRDLILAAERTAWKARLHFGRAKGHAGVSEAELDRVPARGEKVRLSFVGSIRVGGIYRDASQLVTPELSARFDEIARGMREFCYGRFDIRFASADSLARGEAFRIIEVNGAGSEAISAWDPDVPITKVYARLREHQRLMFEIGALNRAGGRKPAGVLAVFRAAWRQTRLIAKYPPSS